MRLIMGGINGNYLREFTDNKRNGTEEVLAAVAYAADLRLFEWCWEQEPEIPLKFYGRLDEDVAVSHQILSKFLDKKSGASVCKLVQHHHAKVIWWRNVGVYIGSANLTDSAWHKNIEVGCFFPEIEISDDMAADLRHLFAVLEEHATPLTDELLEKMKRRAKVLDTARQQDRDTKQFWESPILNKWNGFSLVTKKSANDKKREKFLKEWRDTLQHLRDIGEVVSLPGNRPPWVKDDVPAGALADQFLHAHYYDGRRGKHEMFFEQNKDRRDEALQEALRWWRKLPKAPSSEDKMLNDKAPQLQSALTKDKVKTMEYEQFRYVCMEVHAIHDYAKRAANRIVGLPDGNYNAEEKVTAHSKCIWNDRSADGNRVRNLIQHILYGGDDEHLPERLWQGAYSPEWKIDGLGISALGEMVGWALPDRFPPRNGRTSKALRSLGYNVTVHDLVDRGE